VETGIPARCQVEAWVPGVPGITEVYLPPGFLPERLVGAAVDHTTIHDTALRIALAGLHESLARGEESLDGEARLALIAERIEARLAPPRPARRAPEASVAGQFRDLLDSRYAEPVSLSEAAALIGRSVPHLVRSFTREFGVSPHAYVIGRRIDTARRLLLRGAAPAEVAAAVGFYDQAHFTRHFRRHTSVTPARFARSHVIPKYDET
jgi:AraC-like DNA-binding protein